jgi:retron-type reverse transcriptase
MFTTQSSHEITYDRKSLQKIFNEDTNKVNLCGPNDSIYKTAIQISNLEVAFKKLKASATPGIDGYTKATYRTQLGKSMEKLHRDLKNQKYKPSPVKVVHISKPKGGKRPLGISSVRDKIVQASFYKELSDIYEPKFYDCSFGFRPKKSCHSALKQIKKKWQSVKWFINLDIEKCSIRCNMIS